jgi:UDP-2,3-diacylglucosamine pyrophosphatase LpxH
VVYVPGNHDESIRQFLGLSFGDIKVVPEAIHTTADGRKLWITHGDLFDGVMQYAKWLAYVGDTLYSLILYFNRYLNMLRVRLGLQYWSLSQFLKHQVKNAVSYIADFEMLMAREARLRGCQGVVCGHIHKAEIRMIDNLLYCNDGDWVESLTALVETQSGELKIIHWPRILGDKQQVEEVVIEQPSLPITFPSRIPSPALMAHSNTLPITEKMT